MEIRFDASRSVVKREIRSGQGKISGNRDNECDASLFSVYFPFPLCLSLSLSLSPLAAFLLREGEFCQASCWKFNHPRKRAMIVPRHVTRASLFCIHGCRKREREGERERNREKWGTKRERIQLKGEKQEVLNKTYGVSNKFVEKRRD